MKMKMKIKFLLLILLITCFLFNNNIEAVTDKEFKSRSSTPFETICYFDTPNIEKEFISVYYSMPHYDQVYKNAKIIGIGKVYVSEVIGFILYIFRFHLKCHVDFQNSIVKIKLFEDAQNIHIHDDDQIVPKVISLLIDLFEEEPLVVFLIAHLTNWFIIQYVFAFLYRCIVFSIKECYKLTKTILVLFYGVVTLIATNIYYTVLVLFNKFIDVIFLSINIMDSF